jgi:hypothetical protein
MSVSLEVTSEVNRTWGKQVPHQQGWQRLPKLCHILARFYDESATYDDQDLQFVHTLPLLSLRIRLGVWMSEAK